MYNDAVDIEWTTESSELSNCSRINLDMYQRQSSDNVTYAIGQVGNDMSNVEIKAIFEWTPCDTENPRTGKAYGENIIGTSYFLKLKCLGFDLEARSHNFNLVYALTHRPTPMPSTWSPTAPPSINPTVFPGQHPLSSGPTALPTSMPINSPTGNFTEPEPTLIPIVAHPTLKPVPSPIGIPSSKPTAAPSPLSSRVPKSHEGASSISAGTIVGIGIAVAFFVVLMCLIALPAWRRWNSIRGMKNDTQMTNPLVVDSNEEEEEEEEHPAGNLNNKSSYHRWSDLFRGMSPLQGGARPSMRGKIP